MAERVGFYLVAKADEFHPNPGAISEGGPQEAGPRRLLALSHYTQLLASEKASGKSPRLGRFLTFWAKKSKPSQTRPTNVYMHAYFFCFIGRRKLGLTLMSNCRLNCRSKAIMLPLFWLPSFQAITVLLYLSKTFLAASWYVCWDR